MKKIIVITTEGDSREDGNVYYSNYIIVESTTLKFDEPIFKDPNYGPRSNDDDTDSGDRCERVVEEIKTLGYTVEEPECDFIEVVS